MVGHARSCRFIWLACRRKMWARSPRSSHSPRSIILMAFLQAIFCLMLPLKILSFSLYRSGSQESISIFSLSQMAAERLKRRRNRLKRRPNRQMANVFRAWANERWRIMCLSFILHQDGGSDEKTAINLDEKTVQSHCTKSHRDDTQEIVALYKDQRQTLHLK